MNSKLNLLLDKINNNNKIIIFGKIDCLYCQKTIELLHNKNKKFKFYKLTDDNINLFYELIKELSIVKPEFKININYKTVPIIFINKIFIGGYAELKKILN